MNCQVSYFIIHGSALQLCDLLDSVSLPRLSFGPLRSYFSIWLLLCQIFVLLLCFL